MEAEGGPKHTYTGELYFSAHRGTYTSQAMVKNNNRRCELSMRDLELWGTLAAQKGQTYPAEAIERLWKEVLLHQFHDILPGSSIARVYEDAEKAFHAILEESHELTAKAVAGLVEAGNGVTSATPWDLHMTHWLSCRKALRQVHRPEKARLFRPKRSVTRYMVLQKFLLMVWFPWFLQKPRPRQQTVFP